MEIQVSLRDQQSSVVDVELAEKYCQWKVRKFPKAGDRRYGTDMPTSLFVVASASTSEIKAAQVVVIGAGGRLDWHYATESFLYSAGFRLQR
jgi:hypothetical protein